MKPAAVAAIHRSICERAQCNHLATLNFEDPCASCPNKHWGIYSRKDCDDPAREIPTSQPLNHSTAQLPSPLTMARNAAGALGAVIKHGAQQVSDEERERRLAICEECPHLIVGQALPLADDDRQAGMPALQKKPDRCAKCGCVTSWKSRLAAWHCPVGKW